MTWSCLLHKSSLEKFLPHFSAHSQLSPTLIVSLLSLLLCCRFVCCVWFTSSTSSSRLTHKEKKMFLFFLETPKIAFAASLGNNGLLKTTLGSVDLIYKDVITNVGGAYNSSTGTTSHPKKTSYINERHRTVKELFKNCPFFQASLRHRSEASTTSVLPPTLRVTSQ